MSKQLLMMVGLPRSGKTTWCQKAIRAGLPVVSRDAIRLALHGDRFHHQAEPMVAAITRYAVEALFIAGHETVVLDETNHTEKARSAWKSPHWQRTYLVVSTPPWLCRNRASADRDDEILPVIDRMAGEWDDPPTLNPDSHECVPFPPCGGPGK